MNHRLCSEYQRTWIMRHYKNSEAYHERQVLKHSQVHQDELNRLVIAWGPSPIPVLEISVIKDPFPSSIPKESIPENRPWITNGPHTRIS